VRCRVWSVGWCMVSGLREEASSVAKNTARPAPPTTPVYSAAPTSFGALEMPMVSSEDFDLVWGSGFRVQDLGIRVWGLVFKG
jgi:hypothetical protein